MNLFVYGTLMRGGANHARYCANLLHIREAWVRGRLYDGPGFPALEVPDDHILAAGTADPMADLAIEERWARSQSTRLPAAAAPMGSSWGRVHGELLAFDDPRARLPAIDRLEGFRPGRRSMYRRVLVPVMAGGTGVVAWAYKIEAASIKRRRIESGRWSSSIPPPGRR